MLRALVVVRELGIRLAEGERSGVDPHHAARRTVTLRKRTALRRVDAALRKLERLQHRLVVLVLVLDDHLPDGAHAGHPVEQLERASARLGHVLERLGAPEVGQVAALGPRGLGGVVDVRELGPEWRQRARPLRQPEILERRDVAEIPDERAHQRVVDAVEVLVADALHKCERAPARLGEQLADVGGEEGGGRHGSTVQVTHPVLRGRAKAPAWRWKTKAVAT